MRTWCCTSFWKCAIAVRNWLRDEAHLIGKVGVGVDCALRPREVETEEEIGRGAYRMCWCIAGSISSANAWLDCRKAES